MGTIKILFEHLGKFFIMLSCILIAIASELIFMTSVELNPEKKLLYQSLAISGLLCFGAGFLMVGYLLYSNKNPHTPHKDSRSSQTDDTINSYISDIYATVHKTYEYLQTIGQFLTQLRPADDDSEYNDEQENEADT